MDEATRKEAAKVTSFDIKRVRAFEAMVATEGWKMYQDLINGNVSERTKDIFSPTPKGEESAAEHNKGAVFGLLYARDLPSVIIAAMKDQRSSDPASEDKE